ncbi:MAG: restriction system-associated AAA family ATPase [Gammaproteobacteria bacterium]|nr:restriction system-associated AAA family ATPase [Gammaproteobacteria bacterium]
MKLLRLKITDPAGFRSLQPGFEYLFRTPWEIESELQEGQGFAPFVCAGPNGSGKSNLLEVLAAIFFSIESRYLDFLPDQFAENGEEVDVFTSTNTKPDSFELEYLIPHETNTSPVEFKDAHVVISKTAGNSPELNCLNKSEFGIDEKDSISRQQAKKLLPQYVLGCSSGENEILSLPFFKLRFVQFDEYWNALSNQLPYPGRPETRLAYLDSSFSQAILLCNLLFQDAETLMPFREDVGVEELREFRIIIKRSIDVSAEIAAKFERGGFAEEGYAQGGYYASNPALTLDGETGRHTINLMRLLEAGKDSAENFDPIVTRLKRCATCSFVDETTDTLYLDYYVNEATKEAFKENFDYSPIALFQAFQVLLSLNLYSVSDTLKSNLYKSDSLYVGETVPILASDERIMRFKHFLLKKRGAEESVLLKSLSDGEHQLLHILGLCLLFRNTNSLFLLDEPETHFNPDWRSNFITRLRQCFRESTDTHEMLVTTHAPFLISDSKPEKVLVFKKDEGLGTVNISKPDYNTLGASINKITMNTFGKRETIGGYAQSILEGLRNRFEGGEDKDQLINEINQQLGDSVEKVLLIKTILDGMEGEGNAVPV